MDVGTEPWSVISSNSPEPSSRQLPEAVWYQETTSSTPDGKDDDTPGFFVWLTSQWDITDRNTVFYQISPFFTTQPSPEQQDAQQSSSSSSSSNPTFSLRLPKELAIVEDETIEDVAAAEFGTGITTLPTSPRMQERRVPLLARFSENKKLLAMQFSPALVRICLPNFLEGDDTKKDNDANDCCKHWTIELSSSAKDPHTPLASSPECMPNIVKSTTTTKTTNLQQQKNETILPGGIFWLDQSYGNARGSEYQEHLLMVVTTKSLLCYTITLNSLKKDKTTLSTKLSHVFSHPRASCAWWNPKSLVLLVGSYQEIASVAAATAEEEPLSRPYQNQQGDNCTGHYQQCLLVLRTYFFTGNGPFATHREVLRNPLLLPLRLERPPPVRFRGFPVGTISTGSIIPPSTASKPPSASDDGSSIPPSLLGGGGLESSLSSSPSSSTTTSRANKSQRQKKLPLQCVSVVTLYGKSFIVDIGSESSPTQSGEHFMEVNLHELDQENCVVKIRSLKQRVILPKRIRSSKEDVLFTVLDNLLCVTFRRSKLHLFLDIHDVGSDCSYVVEKMTCEVEQKYLQPSTLALYVSPSYLFFPPQGLVLPLALDLERLAPSVSNYHRCNFSMLLRRQQSASSNGRNIAIARFCAIGALAEPVQRLKWIDNIASAYAQCSSVISCDFHSTLGLMFQCGLLPTGGEFHFPTLDDTMLPSPLGASSYPVLHQQELLSRLFLPKTKKILATSSQPVAMRRVAELAMAYQGALERHGSVICPAMHCFVFALLWRLGDAQAILALCKYRTWSMKHQNNLHGSRRNVRLPRRVAYLGAKWQVSVIMTVIDNVNFGSWSTNRTLTSKQKSEIIMTLRKSSLNLSLIILSSTNDYRYPAEQIAQLLLHNRLLDAISVASSLLDGSGRNAALVYARRRIGGADFSAVATESWNNSTGTSILCRRVQLLHSFLIKWDTDYQQGRRVTSIHAKQLIKDDIELKGLSPKVSNKAKMSRRPSWVAMSRIRRAGVTPSKTSTAAGTPTFQHATAPAEIGHLPHLTPSSLHATGKLPILLTIKQLFG